MLFALLIAPPSALRAPSLGCIHTLRGAGVRSQRVALMYHYPFVRVLAPL